MSAWRWFSSRAKPRLISCQRKIVFRFVCDLATAGDLPKVLSESSTPRTARLVTFFGMIPNFEPHQILPKLTELLRPNDFLLFSANLAPGADYAAGMEKILPQYDNPLTRDWLSAFLFDLGVEPRDGQLRFTIETGGLGLQRVVAKFYFHRAQKIKVGSREFSFARGEIVRLFFSYRYTPARVRKLLGRHGLEVSENGFQNQKRKVSFFAAENNLRPSAKSAVNKLSACPAPP